MKKNIVRLAFIFLQVEIALGQAPDWDWAWGTGGTAHDVSYSVATDNNGNIYTTGIFNQTVDFDPGPGIANLTSSGIDIFLCKFSSDGNFIWARKIGGMEFDICYQLVLDHVGNIYMTGAFTGIVDFDPGPAIFNLISNSSQFEDIFICKFDTSGNFIWAKGIGSSGGDMGTSITIDQRRGMGDLLVTGFFGSTVDFDPGPGAYYVTSNGDLDAFVSRFDSAGNLKWAKAMGGPSTEKPNSISLDSSGNIYTAGFFQGTSDFDPGAGTFYLTSSGIFNSYVSKLDSAGNFLWAKGINGPGINMANGIITNPASAGSVYFIGDFSDATDFDPGAGQLILNPAGSYDIFISKLDSAGNLVWAHQLGGIQSESGLGLSIDSRENIYCTGHFSGSFDFDPGVGVYNLTSAGGSDMFIGKFDSSGNFQWVASGGGLLNEQAKTIFFQPGGRIYTGGYFYSTTVILGTNTLLNTDNTGGTYDLFLSRLDTNLLTGLNENFTEADGYVLFPNPASKDFSISFEGTNKEADIKMFDVDGRLMFKKKFKPGEKISVDDITDGLYFIQLDKDQHLKHFLISKTH